VENSLDYLVGLTRLLGGRVDPKPITSGQYAKELRVSQQTANRILVGLESRGLIKRTLVGRGQRVTLTREAEKLLIDSRASIDSFLESTPSVFEGVLTTGIGEGAYYVDIYSHHIKDFTGWKPYPGTLNLKVTRMPSLASFEGRLIEGFQRDDRTFGGLQLVHATLIAGDVEVDACLLVPERTIKENELEFAAPVNLRLKHSLKDGMNLGFILR